MSITENINELLQSSQDLKSDVRRFLDKVGSDLPIIPLGIRPDSKLIRGAINWVPRHFESVSQLSYKPAKKNIDYQRASIPGKTMFYACPFTHSKSFKNDVFIPRLTSAYEIRSLLAQIGIDGVQRVTFSRWDTTRMIKVFALPFLGEYKRACDEVNYINSVWSKHIKAGNYSTNSLELVKCLSLDISKKKETSKDYAFTAIFIDWFLEQHKEYEGVFYPSVQTEGEGANIAFKHILIDDGSIVFNEASECWILKRGMEAKMITAVKLHENNGELAAEYMPINPQVNVMCNDFPLEGLTFLN